MLAFNLGVFFRNLKGEEVSLAAQNEHCEFTFVGGVADLVEHTDLSHHLAVTLTRQNLSCRIAFEDDQDEEQAENAEVEIQLVQKDPEREIILLRTTFLFEQITLKPTGGEDDSPDPEPISA